MKKKLRSYLRTIYRNRRTFNIVCFGLFLLVLSASPVNAGNEIDVSDSNLKDMQAQQKSIAISGVVTDVQGNKLPGVSVVDKTTKKGTITNTDGVYRITNIDENTILEFLFVGMKKQEIKVNNRMTINVTMEEEIVGLQEVVAVGYATQQKSDLTGAVSSLDFSKISEMPVIDINSALSGQIAGVNVSNSSGTPGGGIDIKIRGLSTIGASARPLYVVDGMPIQESLSMESDPLSLINPSDIQSIDILKDASASAIYGSRASNGVILITTKSGQQQEAKINFVAKVGMQELFNRVDVLDAREFAELAIEARNNRYVELGNDINNPDNLRADNFKLGYFQNFLDSGLPGTDWQSELFKSAPFQDYQLSISGGTKSSRYLISGGFLTQDGIIINTGFDRFSFRSNVDININRKLKLTLRLNPTFTIQDFLPTAGRYHDFYGGIVQAAILMNPILPVYDETKPQGYSYGIAQGNNMQNIENPIARANLIKDKRLNTQLLGNAIIDYKITNGLDLSVSAGTRLRSGISNRLLPSSIGSYSVLPPRDNMIITSGYLNYNWQLSAQLQYQKQFLRHHNITALLVYEIQEEVSNNVTARADGTWTDEIITVDPNTSADLRTGNSNISEWALMSYISRVNYHYNHKYYLTGSVRMDGSSRFAKRWGTFPSVSGAWRVSREDFMQELYWLTNLRLRSSYGVTGNNSIGNYEYYALMGGASYPLGSGTGGIVDGVGLSGYNNPNLTWEKTNQYDVGIDIALFKSRLILEIDWYNKQTMDLLLDMQLPGMSGFRSIKTNIGKVENKGWEYTVKTFNNLGPVKWNSNFNISFNKQKVLALGKEGDPLYGSLLYFANSHITKIGSPVGQFYGLKVIGIYNDWDQINSMPSIQGNTGSRPGEFIFENVYDADNVITLEDRTIIGDPNPDFTFGFTNNFTYKNLSLNVFVRGSVGGDVLNMNFAGDKYTMASNQPRSILNRWQSAEKPGDGMTARVLRAGRGDLGSTTLNSSFVEDASFINIQNVTLNYNIPNKLIRLLKLQEARVFTSIQNLHMFTDYSAYNPEAAISGGSTLTPGSDWSTYPLSRTFTLGLNITL